MILKNFIFPLKTRRINEISDEYLEVYPFPRALHVLRGGYGIFESELPKQRDQSFGGRK